MISSKVLPRAAWRDEKDAVEGAALHFGLPPELLKRMARSEDTRHGQAVLRLVADYQTVVYRRGRLGIESGDHCGCGMPIRAEQAMCQGCAEHEAWATARDEAARIRSRRGSKMVARLVTACGAFGLIGGASLLGIFCRMWLGIDGPGLLDLGAWGGLGCALVSFVAAGVCARSARGLL